MATNWLLVTSHPAGPIHRYILFFRTKRVKILCFRTGDPGDTSKSPIGRCSFMRVGSAIVRGGASRTAVEGSYQDEEALQRANGGGIGRSLRAHLRSLCELR